MGRATRPSAALPRPADACHRPPEAIAMARVAGRSAPFPSAMRAAPVAQLDRAPDYESGGQEFESLRARQQHIDNTTDCQSRKSTCFPSPVYIATMSPRL